MANYALITMLVLGSHGLLGAAGASMVTTTTEGSVTVYMVKWMAGHNGYSDILAKCGDVVIFSWADSMHDVGIATDGDCNQIDESALLAPPANDGKVRIVLDNTLEPIREEGEIYFACSVGRHCANGNQMIEFYVDCYDDAMGMRNSTAPAPAPA